MIQHTVSAALLLRDGFTGKTFADGSGTLCQIDGEPLRRPVWKKEGYLVLTDLPAGEHTLNIRRTGYLEETLHLNTVPGQVWEDTVALKPGIGYRFPQGTIRASITLTRKGKPAGGAELWLGVSSRVVLKLAQDKNAPAEQMIRVFCDGSPSRLPVPGRFLALDKSAPELLYLRSLSGENAELTEPMGTPHARGTELLPVQAYTADENGMIELLLQRPGTMTAFADGKLFTAELKEERQSIAWKLEG